MFADRNNAGFKLAEKLREIPIEDPIVLAIPDGGIETSLPLVECMNISFDLLILEKLHIPNKPEWNFGAITEDGSIAFNEYEKFVNQDEKKQLITEAKQRLRDKIAKFRSESNKLDISGRNVIIVDDGANHGSTLHASINSCKKRKAKSITIAVPVLSSQVLTEIKPRVSTVVNLFSSPNFKGIHNYYRDFKPLNSELFKNRLDVLMTYKKPVAELV